MSFFPWQDLLPELQGVCRAHFNPVDEAHFAMTCAAESERRWIRYLTRFSGARSERSYRMALCAYGTDEQLTDTLVKMGERGQGPIGRALVYYHRQDAFLAACRRNHALALYGHAYMFDTRVAANEFLALGGFQVVHATTECWDIIEGKARWTPLALHSEALIGWALRNGDAALLQSIRPGSTRCTITEDGIYPPWVSGTPPDGMRDLDLHILLSPRASLAVYNWALKHARTILPTSVPYHDLALMKLMLDSGQVDIGDVLGCAEFGDQDQPPGYWPRFVQEVASDWSLLPILRRAIRNRDYALITWTLTRPLAWPGGPRLVHVPPGRMRDQLRADGWLTPAGLVNKTTGETHALIVEQDTQ